MVYRMTVIAVLSCAGFAATASTALADGPYGCGPAGCGAAGCAPASCGARGCGFCGYPQYYSLLGKCAGGQPLPAYQAAPWYLYWPYDGHFLTPAPVTGAFYGPPIAGNFPVNPYFPGPGYGYGPAYAPVPGGAPPMPQGMPGTMPGMAPGLPGMPPMPPRQ